MSIFKSKFPVHVFNKVLEAQMSPLWTFTEGTEPWYEWASSTNI